MKTMNLYSYSGPVLEFGRLIQERWEGQTVASTPAKAKSNLTYQFKRTHNRLLGSKITLPGSVYILDQEETNGA